MKSILLGILMTVGVTVGFAQTATNFTCNDCSGVSHDLFTELDAGKVIVLNWVMPCSACAGPSLTTYNVVTSFQAANPGKVFQYIVDDYANTACSSLNAWANSVNVPQNAWSLRFSNAAINMLDYGATGMPKIVVVGGVGHVVFYSAINTVNASALQNAINLALSTSGVNEQNSLVSLLKIYPNPVDKISAVEFTLAKPAAIKVEVFNLQGKKMQEEISGQMAAGLNKVEINTSKLAAATYLVKLTADGNSRFINLVVSH